MILAFVHSAVFTRRAIIQYTEDETKEKHLLWK